MRIWLNNRQNQISMGLVAIMVITISNFILPVYETLSYYRDKTASLEKKYQQLYGYSLHITHHENQLIPLQSELADLEQKFTKLRNAAALQKYFGDIQRECQLKVIIQEIKKGELSQELETIHIHQMLDGKYNDHMRYLNAILSGKSDILLEEYVLENRSPFSGDPQLTAQLVLTLFIPLK